MSADWRHFAACRNEEPELFHPAGNTAAAAEQADEAKAVCRRCPVMDACAQWALSTRQEHGIWGGLDEGELRAILRRAGRQNRASNQPAEARPKKTKTSRNLGPIECGTRRGYRRHHRNGEPACDPCRYANAAADRRLRTTGTTTAA